MEEPTQPQPAAPRPFRVTRPVFLVLALLLVALALPLGLMLFGFHNFRKSYTNTPAQAEPDLSGLRNSLTSVAEARLPNVNLPETRRRYVFIGNQAELLRLRSEVELVASKLGGVVLEGNSDSRIVLQIPANGVARFESQALAGSAMDSSSSEELSVYVAYEISFKER